MTGVQTCALPIYKLGFSPLFLSTFIYDWSFEDSSPTTERYIIVLTLAKRLNGDVERWWLRSGWAIDERGVSNAQGNIDVCAQACCLARSFSKLAHMLSTHTPVITTIIPFSCHVRHSTTSSAHEIERHAPSIGHPITFGTWERCKLRAWGFTCMLFFEISYSRSPGTKSALYADGELLSFNIGYLVVPPMWQPSQFVRYKKDLASTPTHAWLNMKLLTSLIVVLTATLVCCRPVDIEARNALVCLRH